MTQQGMDIEEVIKTDHLFHPMRQLQRRSGAFLFKSSRKSEDRQMVPFVESCWILF